MASKQQIQDFIEKIAPCAQEGFKAVGKVLPSVCIGMACVESAYGTAGSCKHNSYLGQKVGSGKTAKKYWGGQFFTSKTKEEYTVGIHTTITDAFRAYNSMLQCVLNYYELLNTGLYKRVLPGVGYREQMQQIKDCGYMTSSTEVKSVIAIIEKYGLTKYDEVRGGNPYPNPTENVREGSRGSAVRWLQYELCHQGYSLVIDGIAGPRTIEALKSFQRSAGLEADGIAGAATRGALKCMG